MAVDTCSLRNSALLVLWFSQFYTTITCLFVYVKTCNKNDVKCVLTRYPLYMVNIYAE